MGRSKEVWEYELFQALDGLGFVISTYEARLLLVELMVKVSAGSYVSHTEQLFLDNMKVMKKDRTPNKRGFRFLREMLYKSSNQISEFAELSKSYRF